MSKIVLFGARSPRDPEPTVEHLARDIMRTFRDDGGDMLYKTYEAAVEGDHAFRDRFKMPRHTQHKKITITIEVED